MSIFNWLKYIVTFLFILLLAIYTYIKSRLFGNKRRAPILSDRQSQIAIVGGGIGGVGAAFALLRNGYKNVTIFEERDKLGGNAKTHTWKEDGQSITTGLSVLAWPEMFRNYIHLLNELDIKMTTVQLPFFIHNQNERTFFAHGKQHIHTQQYNKELKRWIRMVKLVNYVSRLLHGNEVSLYHFSLLNPFNYIPLRLLSLLFGISSRFWNNIVVPMYGTTFLSTNLSYIPSSIISIVDSLISLEPNRIPTMQAWLQTSTDVFDKMTEGAIIKTNYPVKSVRIRQNQLDKIQIFINDENVYYDRIIFACNGPDIIKSLDNGKTTISSLLRIMLSNVTYADQTDPNLLDGIIHRDINILPTEYANELCERYANYIDVRYNRQKKTFYHYNTFILSSWLPNVNEMLESKKLKHKDIEPMLVTYASVDQPVPEIDLKKVCGAVDNRRAHPSLSLRNQTISLLTRLVQGENGMYFCASSVTPANGHDLSMLSGFAVAELIGAKYPFADNLLAFRDYNRFKRMCID